MRTAFLVWSVLLIAAGGCSRNDETGADSVTVGGSSVGSPAATRGAGDTVAASGSIADSIRESKKVIGEDSPPVAPPRIPPTTMSEHLTRLRAVLDTASAATLKPMLLNHPQMLDSTMNSMAAEMKRTNTTPSAAWTALSDSLRKDLTTLSSIGDDELVAFMRAHHGRCVRLLQLHRSGT